MLGFPWFDPTYADYLASQENLIGVEPRTFDRPRVNLTNRQMKGLFYLSVVLGSERQGQNARERQGQVLQTNISRASMRLNALENRPGIASQADRVHVCNSWAQ